MPTLRELQTTVMKALLGSSPEPALALMAARGQWASTQLRVYQNNVAASFTESLRSSYPAIARLVGEDYFRQIAHGLQRRHPSRSGDLLWVGQQFPAYLKELHGEGEYQYLPEVARLEWLCQESLLAADHAPLNLSKLAGAAAEDYDSLVFLPHPTLRFFDSRFPVLRIWESNVSNLDGEPESIELTSGADCLFLLRPQLTLTFHRLNAGERRFSMGLLGAAPFAAIVEECMACDLRFDATATLQRFVGMGAIADCRM
jgi:hypothetical protein